MNPRQRRVKSTRPPLLRGYFSRAVWVAATFPGWTHYRHTKRDLRSKPRPRALLARERCLSGPSCGIPAQPGLRLSARSFRTHDPSPEVPWHAETSTRLPAFASCSRAPRGTNQRLHPHVRHQRQMKPQRWLRRLSSIHPQPAPRESRSVYLAFLSPRIRVRHWVDEGQGKGAEAVAAGAAEVV